MNQIVSRIKFLFIPFLPIAVLAISTYSFLFWLIRVRLKILNLRDDIGSPMVLMLVFVLALLLPRFKRFSNTSPALMSSLFMAWGAMVAPCVPIQSYIKAVTAKLIVLDHVSQFNDYPPDYYYRLKNFYIDKQFARFKTTVKVGGKRHDYLAINTFAVTPLLDNSGAAGIVNTEKSGVAWLGAEYPAVIDNKLPQPERDEQYRAAIEEGKRSLQNKNLYDFKYLVRLEPAESENYIAAVRSKDSLNDVQPVIFLPTDISLDDVRKDKLFSVFLAFGLGSLVFLIALIVTPKK